MLDLVKALMEPRASIGVIKLNLLLLFVSLAICGVTCQQDVILKTDILNIELLHKFDIGQDFTPRGEIVVKPKTEYRPASASIVSQVELTSSDLDSLQKASSTNQNYYLRANLKKKVSNETVVLKTTQTLTKACALIAANLVDTIVVNLSPSNDLININFFTSDPECSSAPSKLGSKFKTKVVVDSASIGPAPDTAFYIKRLEEERMNKAKEGKQDDRSFFAKYWIYIVPAIVILMMFSGPEQGAAR